LSAGQLARVALLLAAAVPVKAWSRLPVLCPSRWIGQRCPGCGMTRAAALVLRGDLAGAIGHNVLLLPAVAYLAARWAYSVAPHRTGWLPAPVRSPEDVGPAVLRAFAALLVAFAVARNLPAFAFLAPPELG
jgi:hypothetical protein